MAKKKLKLPSGSKTSAERKKIKERPHFDFDCDIFSEEHFGMYLIVKNSDKKDRTKKHNRLYLDSEKELEFLLETGFGSAGLTSENYKGSMIHLFSNNTRYKELIQNIIFKINRNENRTTVSNILYGVYILINIFEDANKDIPNNPDNFNAEIHQKCVTDAILEGKITKKTYIKNLRKIWVFIRKNFESNIGTIPNKISAQTEIKQLEEDKSVNTSVNKEKENNDEITLETLFQLDYYSQIELDRIIGRAKEYKQWIKELDTQGDLFSKANLLKTYFNNYISSYIRQLYIHLYNEDPQCWITDGLKYDKMVDGKIKYKKITVYACQEEETRHKKLINISKNGIDISIKNEKMFAWWHKVLLPEWPFIKTVVEPYNEVIKNGSVWIKKQVEKVRITSYDLSERILPNVNTAYVMYLRLLIDTSINTDTLSNVEVHKKEDGNYVVGSIHHNLRMLDSVKFRNNTVPPSFIAKGTFIDKCVDFYSKWVTPIYERSDNKTFLQYIGKEGKEFYIDSNTVKQLNPKLPKKLKHISSQRSFFERYEIYKNVEKDDSENKVLEKNRLFWIKHKNIRSANNFKNYHILYGEWIRAHTILGHEGDQTEKNYYHNNTWKLGEEHQTANSVLQIQKFIEGKVSDKKLENVFLQPHCGCKDNLSPTFDNAPLINDGEVCTSWRYCLTRCDNSRIFPKQHGPTILAWKNIMEQERGQFIRIEDWEKEYSEDYAITEIILNKFKEEDKEFSKLKAAERMPFVRLMMMQGKLKRKIIQATEVKING